MTNRRQEKNAIASHFFNRFILVEEEVMYASRKPAATEPITFAITAKDSETP